MASLPFYSTTEKEGYIGAKTAWVDLGEGARGFLGIPTRGAGPYRAMIIGHERYGLVLDSLDLVAMFAASGYVALAPDMASSFEGDKDALHRGDIGGGWTPETVQLYMAQSYDYLAGMSEVNSQQIAAIGFCASGGWGWVCNAVRPDLAASVCYYGGGRYNQDLMAKVTCPTLYVYGENDHTTPIERVFAFRDEIEKHDKNCEVRLVGGMPHGWLNDTMIGRYRQKEASEAWRQIFGFLDRVYSGYFAEGRVRQSFEADFAVDYDFSKNVRYGTGPLPEPDIRAFTELKKNVAQGRVPRAELDAQLALYPEYFGEHPELLP